MRARERKLLTRVETRRRDIIAESDRRSAAQLTFRPAPGAWSTLDVIEHLVKVEEAIVSRIRPREPRSLREAAKAKATLLAMRVVFGFRRRVKVPLQAVVPLGGATLHDLAERWEGAERALEARLEAFGPGDWSRPMMRHPVLGLLTPAEALTFLRCHMGHHRRQIARLERAPGYPPS